MCTCRGGEDFTQIDLTGSGLMVGLHGLQQLFVQLHKQGCQPDESLGDELLRGIRLQNYVPPSAEQLYKTALVREYAAFCQPQVSKG